MRVLVIGIGNDSSGDDAAGLLAVRGLRHISGSGETFLEHTGDGTGLVEAWRGFSHVFVVDAVQSGARAGTIHRWTGLEDQPTLRRSSTHAFGLAEAWRLGKALQILPTSLVVYGIEGSDFGVGRPVSAAVRRGIATAVARLDREIKRLKSTEEMRDA